MTSEAYDDPAEQAFGQLRAEIALLRRAVEGLATAEERQEPIDYGPSLREMATQVSSLEQAVAALAAAPALRLTPNGMAGQIEAVTARAQSNAQREWLRAQHCLDDAVRDLRGLVAHARSAREQWWWLGGVGIGGVVLGVVLWIVLSGPVARALPARWQVAERMAAATLKQDRWTAGGQMMHGVSPRDWARIVEMSQFERDNREALGACREAAAKAGKMENCRVVVRGGAAPLPPN